MMSGNPFPQNAWLTYAEATARWGNPTSPKQVEYILATTEALSAHPAVRALVAEAEARGMERAANVDWQRGRDVIDPAPDFLSDWQRGLVAGQQMMRDAILAEAASIRREATK